MNSTINTETELLFDYTIVVPVYYNEGSLEALMAILDGEVLNKNEDLRGEILFVDDGSGDNSLAELLKLQIRYKTHVKVVALTRNFGQSNALLAGFTYAKGRCVITMSADGQDPPELINQMLHEHFSERHEIVICTRSGRDESWFRVLTSRIFYSLMRHLTFPNMPPGGFDFTLIGRRALAVLLRNHEAHNFFQGQVLWTGFQPKFIPYHRRARQVGVSKWSLGRKVTYLLDGVFAYSFSPIRIMSLTGIIFALLGFLYAVAVFISRLMYGTPMKGWAPLMIVILVMGGTQMLMLGVIGEYLWRTLAQSRNRDPFVVASIYEDGSAHLPTGEKIL